MLSEASELSVWAGRPAVLEEVHRLQTRWDQLASGSVSRRENLEVELKVCMELLPTVLVLVVVAVNNINNNDDDDDDFSKHCGLSGLIIK